MKAEKPPLVVVIGGGTGTYTVLTGLKEFPCRLAAVVSMADSGGSNRVLRDEFGILPTSDLRQCMVALASTHGNREVLRRLFTYRFHQGEGIAGMTFGNLFMAALTDIYQDQAKAIRVTCEVLGIKDQILPVTLDNVQLVARYEDGSVVVGEHEIDEPKQSRPPRIEELSTRPKATISSEVKKVLAAADLVVIGPGDLYTSLICNLVVEGVVPAIRSSRAKKIYVMNLMTKWGQTTGFTARDYLSEVEKYLGKKVIDGVIINNHWRLPSKILARYQREKSVPVKDNLTEADVPRLMRAKVISPVEVKKQRGDGLWRSIVRHDPHRLARSILKFLPKGSK